MSWRVYLANRLETAIQLVMWMVALHLPWFNQPNHALFWKRCGFNQSRSQTAFCSLGTRLSRGHGDKITQNIIHHQATHNNRDTKISKSDSVDYFSSSSAASAARRPGAPITPPPEWIVEYITFYTPHFWASSFYGILHHIGRFNAERGGQYWSVSVVTWMQNSLARGQE